VLYLPDRRFRPRRARNIAATEKRCTTLRPLKPKTGAPVQSRCKDRAALSEWIDAHKASRSKGAVFTVPSSKHGTLPLPNAVGGGLKRRAIFPQECFRDQDDDVTLESTETKTPA